MTTLPDPERLGGLAWTRRTGGILTSRERRGILAAVAVGQWENAVGRAKLALGRLPEGAEQVDASTFAAPDSRLARECEEACAEQPDFIAGHSYRTWMFGLALAAVDRENLDPEQFYCAALLHDYGCDTPTPGEDFTLRAADRTLRCAESAGLPVSDAEQVADAICVHPTPGITVAHDGALGCYVQWGAMLDGAGLRKWDVAPANVATIIERHPRGAAFKRELIGVVRAEAKATPSGRFGLLVRCGMPLAVRVAPFRDRGLARLQCVHPHR